MVSNEEVDGKQVGLNGLDKNLSRTGRRHFWHSDLSYMAVPPLGSILHAKKLPESGDGDTLFCDMYAAYETLDPAMKEEIEGLHAYHSFWAHTRIEAAKKLASAARFLKIIASVPEAVSHRKYRSD